MIVEGEDWERSIVPASGRVYAPQDWRGDSVLLLVPRNGYTVTADEEGVSVEAEALYKREARTGAEGQNPPQLRVDAEHEGSTVLLVRGPRTT